MDRHRNSTRLGTCSGYKLETFALHDSNYQVRRLDGYEGLV